MYMSVFKQKLIIFDFALMIVTITACLQNLYADLSGKFLQREEAVTINQVAAASSLSSDLSSMISVNL